jgi:hypothetical protein
MQKEYYLSVKSSLVPYLYAGAAQDNSVNTDRTFT